MSVYSYNPKTNETRCMACRTLFAGRKLPEHDCQAECAHRSQTRIGMTSIDTCCGGSFSVEVFGCEIYGQCTTLYPSDEIKGCCAGCSNDTRRR